MADKLVVLVTGANQGIGYYAAQKLAGTGKYQVLIGSRDVKKGEKAVKDLVADDSVPVKEADLEALELDIDSDASIQAATETVEKKYGRLDILVNNAGISRAKEGATLREQFQTVFNTNVFGPAVCTDLFLPLLRKSTAEGGKRIVFVASVVGCMTLVGNKDPSKRVQGPEYMVYGSSKTADNMIMIKYANILENEGFVVSSICPGYCGTNLTDYHGYKDARDGAKPIITAIESKGEDVHLQFLHEEEPNGRYPF